jgi:O-antigen/teichoic acid export membrane protein
VFLGQAVVSGGNFLTSVILVRLLGLEAFGVFSVVWLLVLFSSSLVAAVCVFPMMSNFYRVDKTFRRMYIYGTMGTLIVLLLLLVLPILIIWLSFYTGEASFATVLALMFCLLAVNFQDFLRKALITLQLENKAFLSDVINISSRIIILVMFYQWSTLNIILALSACAIGAVLGVIVVWRALPIGDSLVTATKFSWSWNQSSVKWLLPSGLMQWTSINLFISAAAVFISPAAVGVIRLCQSLLAVLNVIIQGLESVIPIEASKIFNRLGSDAMVIYLLRVSAVGIVPFLLLSLGCLFYGGDLISIVYGESYRAEAEAVLFIYSLAYVFVFMIVPVRAALRAIGRTRIWFNAYLASSIFSVSTVYFLEINYEVLGAVYGILFAHIVLILYAILSFPKNKVDSKNEIF